MRARRVNRYGMAIVGVASALAGPWQSLYSRPDPRGSGFVAADLRDSARSGDGGGVLCSSERAHAQRLIGKPWTYLFPST